MNRARIRVTRKNFRKTWDDIQHLIDSFQINAEKWVLDLFEEIPTDGGPEAVQALQKWIDDCLSETMRLKLKAPQEALDPEPTRIRLSPETMEQLNGFRRFHGFESYEATIRELMEAYRQKHSW